MVSNLLKQKNRIRLAALVLLVIAFFGPWGYNSDGVPPPEWCDDPAFLLERDRCVTLLAGTEILSFWGQIVLVLPMLSVGLITGEYTLYDMRGEFFALPLLILLILPIFTTLTVIAWKNSRRWNLLNRVAWSLTFLPGLWLAVNEPVQRPGQLWGVWLFVVVAIAMAALEWTSLRASWLTEPGTS